VANEYVRVCPVCERENPPERARCACGASLAGVDFSLKGAPVAATAATTTDAPPAASTAPADPPPAPPAPPFAIAADISAPAAVTCPYADCAQPNPPGSERCVYCNRPLVATTPAIAGARPLPAALRDNFSVADVFPATGSEADILLVTDVRTGERRVAKLYRKGIAPDFQLLDVLAQSVGDTVVRVLDHGTSDGAAYELLEYIPGGTLERLLRSGPLPVADIRRIVEEIAEALIGIHAHRILHRDLKPENVLIRHKSPLELALTDFGIASFSAATQHFTSVARTTRYAAPEALTGVLDAKSDWWSLGMIVLEAASGRHPFDGLTEQVMNHHLATRPIDTRGVYDDALRTLCRGLLLRDPKRRWGGDEVARWLAADPTLAVADDADGAATVVRPYRIGTAEATTAAELAVAFARNWDAARKDLARGQVARWLEQDLHDYNLVRVVRDIHEEKDASDDTRLLRFLLAAAPDLPPVWRGKPVTADAVLAAARAAADGDEDAQQWLDSLHRDSALATFVAGGHAALAELDRTWRAGWKEFTDLWAAACQAEEKWRQQARDVGGGPDHHVVSFDDLAYNATGRLALPPPRTIHGALLVALNDAAYVDALRGEVTGGQAAITGYCAWYEKLWDQARHRPVGVLAARHLLPHAQDDGAAEARRRAATAGAHARSFEEAKAALRAAVAVVIELAPGRDKDLPTATITQLQEAFGDVQRACEGVLRAAHTDPDYDALRRSSETLSSFASVAQRTLAEAEAVRGVNAIFLTPARLAMGLAVMAGALLSRAPVLILVVVGALALVLAYRWYVSFEATEAALTGLQRFGLHGRTFLRADDHAREKEGSRSAP
jgi:hypothetical protein